MFNLCYRYEYSADKFFWYTLFMLLSLTYYTFYGMMVSHMDFLPCSISILPKRGAWVHQHLRVNKPLIRIAQQASSWPSGRASTGSLGVCSVKEAGNGILAIFEGLKSVSLLAEQDVHKDGSSA